MTRWFRFYDDALNDPKVLRLSDKLHRIWIGILCVASKNDGQLPALEDMALMIRMKPEKLEAAIKELITAGLIDDDGPIRSPHNWDKRQYKSDVSTERVKRFRKQERNVSVTPPEADTEQNRAEAEQTRAGGTSSEKVLKSDLLEIFTPSRNPDLSRVSVWLSKGYSHTMILDVVKELLARKPDISSLNYFDAALAERYLNRQETPSEKAEAAAKIDMEKVVEFYVKTGVWSKYAGPEPGLSGCRAPPEILAKYGLVRSDDRIPAPTMSAMQ